MTRPDAFPAAVTICASAHPLFAGRRGTAVRRLIVSGDIIVIFPDWRLTNGNAARDKFRDDELTWDETSEGEGDGRVI